MNALLIAALLAASTISPEAAPSPQPPAAQAEKPSHIVRLSNGRAIQVDDDVCSETEAVDETFYIFVVDGRFSVSSIDCAHAVKNFIEAGAKRPLDRA